MNRWLLKTEPTDYSLDDLERDERTVWDGVANNAALKFMRDVKRGDRCLIYHTGNDKAAVGVAKVGKGPYEQDGVTVFDVAFASRLARPVTLKAIKAEPSLASWALVKQPRLSVMPVTEREWDWVMEKSEER